MDIGRHDFAILSGLQCFREVDDLFVAQLFQLSTNMFCLSYLIDWAWIILKEKIQVIVTQFQDLIVYKVISQHLKRCYFTKVIQRPSNIVSLETVWKALLLEGFAYGKRPWYPSFAKFWTYKSLYLTVKKDNRSSGDKS